MEISGSASNIAVQSIQSGLEGMKQSADQIAKSNQSDQSVDIAKAAVDMIADRNQVEASVKVVQAESAMTKTIGSLLDVTA